MRWHTRTDTGNRGHRRVVVPAFILLLTIAQIVPSRAETIVERTILGPTSGHFTGYLPCDTSEPDCEKTPATRPARCLYLLQPELAQDAQTGKIAYVIAIDEEMRGKPFRLSSVPPNTADFDVIFFESLGICQDDSSVDYSFMGQRAIYGHYGNQDEVGVVPRAMENDEEETEGANYAIVTVFGTNATFRFTV